MYAHNYITTTNPQANTSQMVSPSPRAIHAVSRTSSKNHLPIHSVWRQLTNTICSGLVLEKVCEYFYYNEKHKNSKDVPDMDVPAELCLELLMAADYLNGKLCEAGKLFLW
jgi:hypothetical protein